MGRRRVGWAAGPGVIAGPNKPSVAITFRIASQAKRVRAMADDRHAEDWYIAQQGQPHGPVSWDDVLDLFRAGRVSATDFVWREGLEDWVALGTMVGPATPPPVPTSSPPALDAAAVQAPLKARDGL